MIQKLIEYRGRMRSLEGLKFFSLDYWENGCFYGEEMKKEEELMVVMIVFQNSQE